MSRELAVSTNKLLLSIYNSGVIRKGGGGSNKPHLCNLNPKTLLFIPIFR
jgi:hypothetical protein